MGKAERKDGLIYAPAPNKQARTNQSDTIISFPKLLVINPKAGHRSEPQVDNFAFSDKQIRQGFIRKVYSIIMMQLLITCIVIAWFMYDKNLQFAVRRNTGIFMAGILIVYFTTAICMICCEGPRRRVPYNYIFLLMFTLSLSALVGVACSYYQAKEVLLAAGVTLAIVLALTLFAFQTKIDFTMLSGSLFCLLLVFTLFGVIMMFSPFRKARLIYLGIGVLIMCLYLVYDTQLMIGGKHQYALSPEEYVFAALMLYLDVMYIFIKILRMLR